MDICFGMFINCNVFIGVTKILISWTCLAQWLNAQSRNPTCPVCKAGCGKDKVIPIYGRGKEEKDPR